MDQRQLYPVSKVSRRHTPTHSHTCPHTLTQGEVCVGQSVLDVEVWANRVLSSELESCDLSYHCLRDYDLEIVEVSAPCLHH